MVKFNFNIVALFALVVGVGFGLEAYRVSRDNQFPPVPKYEIGTYVEYPSQPDSGVNPAARSDKLNGVYQVSSILLRGSPGKYWYYYTLEKELGNGVVAREEYNREENLNQGDTLNQIELRDKFYEQTRLYKNRYPYEQARLSINPPLFKIGQYIKAPSFNKGLFIWKITGITMNSYPKEGWEYHYSIQIDTSENSTGYGQVNEKWILERAEVLGLDGEKLYAEQTERFIKERNEDNKKSEPKGEEIHSKASSDEYF